MGRGQILVIGAEMRGAPTLVAASEPKVPGLSESCATCMMHIWRAFSVDFRFIRRSSVMISARQVDERPQLASRSSGMTKPGFDVVVINGCFYTVLYSVQRLDHDAVMFSMGTRK